MCVFILFVILFNMFCQSVYGKTYYKITGNWQGWYESAGCEDVDGDIFRVYVDFGYKHTDNKLEQYKYTGMLSSSAYSLAVNNVTAKPAVPAVGREASIGRGYIDIEKQDDECTVTITARIKNETTGTLTDIRTFDVVVPAKDPPIEIFNKEIDQAEAEIVVSKTLLGGINSDTYEFEIEAVKGWSNESESTFDNGQNLVASELPMPRETRIEIGDINKTTSHTKSASFGTISYSEPGWYMYRVREVIPSVRNAGVKYDESVYYVVVYVVNGADGKVAVKNVTAWHNNKDSMRNLPNLTDISAETDSDDGAKVNDGPNIFGKTDAGEQAVMVRFWNRQEVSTLKVMKNVTGSLGDRSAVFDFELKLANMSGSTSYKVIADGAVLAEGFNEDAFMTDNSGAATLHFGLEDDASIAIEGMPVGATCELKEAASNHVASFTTCENGDVIDSGSNEVNNKGISTRVYTIKENKELSITVNNEKSIVPVTGVVFDGWPYLLLLMLLSSLAILTAVSSYRLRGDA